MYVCMCVCMYVCMYMRVCIIMYMIYAVTNTKMCHLFQCRHYNYYDNNIPLHIHVRVNTLHITKSSFFYYELLTLPSLNIFYITKQNLP